MDVQAVAVGFVLGYLGYFLSTNKRVKLKKNDNYKFVMVIRTDILRTNNTAAVHCSSVTLECYKKAKLKYPDALSLWEKKGQPKIVLKLNKNENEEILTLHRKAGSLGLISVPLKEDCNPQSQNDYTIIGIGPGPEDLINEVTGHLKLL